MNGQPNGIRIGPAGQNGMAGIIIIISLFWTAILNFSTFAKDYLSPRNIVQSLFAGYTAWLVRFSRKWWIHEMICSNPTIRRSAQAIDGVKVTKSSKNGEMAVFGLTNEGICHTIPANNIWMEVRMIVKCPRL